MENVSNTSKDIDDDIESDPFAKKKIVLPSENLVSIQIKHHKKEGKCKTAPKINKCTAESSKFWSKEKKIFMFLSSPEMKAYAYFLLNVIPVFDRVNGTLQSASPLMYKLREIYWEVLKEILCRFLKPIFHNKKFRSPCIKLPL